MRKYFTAAALLALFTSPLAAQNKGTIEIGAFLKYTDYDNSFGTARNGPNSWGGGGRLGYFLSHQWELEADGSGNATDVKNFFKGFESTALTYYPFHLRLNWNKRLGSNSPFTFLLGVGPAFNRYGKRVVNEPGFRGFDWGIAPLTGFRVMLTHWLAFRVDGTLDYVPSPHSGKTEVTSQGTGIVAASPPSKNINLGAQAGLSVMLGMCRRDKDGTTISPSTANITIGGTASFSSTATNCGKSDEVVYTVSGPGSVSPAGVYTSNAVGTATVTACGKSNKLCSTATVNVAPIVVRDTAPTPPPAGPRTLTSCELSPATSSPRIDQPVPYSVTLRYSDGSTETMQNVTVSAPGGTVSGNTVSWSSPGSKTITVTCGSGVTATATADVQQFTIVVRDSVYFMVDSTRIYRTDDQGSLDAVAKVLIEHPDIRLVIDGHTDADATVKYNERLAMNRAIAMKEYLRTKGVPVDRMTIMLRSFSECVPIAPNATAAGRAQNRRAELSEFGNTQPGPANASCSEAGRERKP